MKLHALMRQLAEAYRRLQEAVVIDPQAPLAVDGTIQRFEFCFELSWKAINAWLATEGINASSPKACLKAAFQQGLVTDEAGWLALLEMRNLTVHVYDESLALRIYTDIIQHHGLIAALIAALDTAVRKNSTKILEEG